MPGTPKLYHFSEESDIVRFEPRPVLVPAERRPGQDWLNGPLVWAIDEWHAPMYLFPRECPRILLWPTAVTTDDDRERWFGYSTARMIAYIEWAWFDRLCRTTLYRYLLPAGDFVDLEDAGMWVSRAAVVPGAIDCLEDLPAELESAGIELRVAPSLLPLKDIWDSSLHASGIRLRNAVGWGQPSLDGGPRRDDSRLL